MDSTTKPFSDRGPASDSVRMPDHDHWLAVYIRNLLQAYTSGNTINFETAESLLAQEREAFERDLAVARRIYRLYPHLVDDPSRSPNVERPGA